MRKEVIEMKLAIRKLERVETAALADYRGCCDC
jgi:hypothetical protein